MTSQGAAAGPPAGARLAAGSPGPEAARAAARSDAWAPPDLRRWLQLGLAAIWVLDGVLQYQSFMFTRAFGQMLAGGADGNPAFLADSVRWSAGIIEHSPVTANAAFATIQLALGLGIAWRPVARAALACSVLWSAAVWWFGEGLGGLLNGTASPVSGAPGAVILYALLAILVWPAAGRPGPADPGAELRDAARPGAGGTGAEPSGGPSRRAAFVAALPLGAAAARGLWAVLWGSLAFFSVTAGSRTAQGLHDMIAGMAGGEPGWLASLDRGAAGVLAHHGLPASIALAAVLAAIAAGVFLPARGARLAVGLAVLMSLVIWLVGQDLGEILAGDATDVNSGPLLALIALAYWPLGARPAARSYRAAVPRSAAVPTELGSAAAPGRGTAGEMTGQTS